MKLVEINKTYIKFYSYHILMNTVNKDYLTRLFDDLQVEKTFILNEIKNDKELKKVNVLNQKLKVLDNLITNSLKYRNILLKTSNIF